MKKIVAMLLVAAMAFTITACGTETETTTAAETTAAETTAAETTAAVETTSEASPVTVMNHEQYVEAALDSEVTVETYVQAKQSWWEDKATLYTQAEDGAYFIYNMACSQEEYEKLVPGTKIRVTGFKTEWSGEVEITDAKYEIIEGSFIAEPLDVTTLLGSGILINHQNELVSFKNLVIVASNEAGDAFLYNWDGSGEEGSDLYFKAAKGETEYQFTVESYLCGADTEVYKAVKELAVGDTVDMEGFLYWYEGANPHITNIAVTAPGEDTSAAKSDGVMTYEEYAAAELDTEVTVEAYVQAKQSWWEDKATVYTQDADGAYFLYNMACSQEDYDKLEAGTLIRVHGFKTEWAGEVEITDATFEIVEAEPFIAEAEDVTSLLGKDELIDHMNKFVAFKGVTVEAANEAGDAFLYNWDGSGEEGSDLYFKASADGQTYTFTVESYLCGPDTDVYQAVKALKVGDVIDMEGFLYWYEGVNPHITSVVTTESGSN